MSSSGYCDDKQDPSLPRTFKLEDISKYLPLRYKDKVELNRGVYVLVGYPFVTYNDVNGPVWRVYTTERDGTKLDWSAYLDDSQTRSSNGIHGNTPGLVRVVCKPNHFVKGEILALTYSNKFEGEYLVYLVGAIYPPVKPNINRDEFVAIRVRQTAGPAFVPNPVPSPGVILPPIVEPLVPEPKPELPPTPPPVTPPTEVPVVPETEKPGPSVDPPTEVEIPFFLSVLQLQTYTEFKERILQSFASLLPQLEAIEKRQATNPLLEDLIVVIERIDSNPYIKEGTVKQLLVALVTDDEKRELIW